MARKAAQYQLNLGCAHKSERNFVVHQIGRGFIVRVDDQPGVKILVDQLATKALWRPAIETSAPLSGDLVKCEVIEQSIIDNAKLTGNRELLQRGRVGLNPSTSCERATNTNRRHQKCTGKRVCKHLFWFVRFVALVILQLIYSRTMAREHRFQIGGLGIRKAEAILSSGVSDPKCLSTQNATTAIRGRAPQMTLFLM
jgi:hypothetical protein